MPIGFNPMYGIETLLMSKAAPDQKEIFGSEIIGDQHESLDTRASDAQRLLLMQTLAESADIENIMDELVAVWRHGDIDYLEKSMLADMQEFPELYDALVVNRNQNWTQQIEALLDDDQDYLISVGALHLIGKDGLHTLLRERGQELTQRRHYHDRTRSI